MNALRASEILTNDEITLIAVESVEYRRSRILECRQIYACIRPVALIIHSAEETYALDMESKRVDLDRLRRDVPELGDILQANG